ncbi:MAG: hypothetical protein ABI980_11600 [Nitrospirota bacterium]
MKWTSKTPRSSGWYWWREPGIPLMGIIVQVDVETDTVYSSGTDADASLSQKVGVEWFGPLEMPE